MSLEEGPEWEPAPSPLAGLFHPSPPSRALGLVPTPTAHPRPVQPTGITGVKSLRIFPSSEPSVPTLRSVSPARNSPAAQAAPSGSGRGSTASGKRTRGGGGGEKNLYPPPPPPPKPSPGGIPVPGVCAPRGGTGRGGVEPRGRGFVGRSLGRGGAGRPNPVRQAAEKCHDSTHGRGGEEGP